MPGRIKSGEGTLIGNAGEYYVVAELLRQSKIAALAPRNTPAFDILATDKHKTVKIRVKTKSKEVSDWQWMAKEDEDKTIFKDLDTKRDDDFTVLVDLAPPKELEFYIVPTVLLDRWLRQDFQDWLDTPGKKHPHDPSNRKRNLNMKKFNSQLQGYMDWEILWR